MRLFIATTFPRDVLRPLNERIASVKPRLPHGSWVREESQHLTFAFLGEQEESIVEPLATRLTQHVATVPKFEAKLEGAGFFPNSRRARVGWVGVDPPAPFEALANAVRAAVK